MKKAAAGSPSFTAIVAAEPLKSTAEVCKVESGLEIPSPENGEVLIKVAAIGLNPVDWKRTKVFGPMCAHPGVPGVDGAGIVEKVGEGVTLVKAGDRVQFHTNFAKGTGSFAEYAVALETSVVALPESISFVDGAALPCPAWTAYEGLFDRMRINEAAEGTFILITGGAGGVGQSAIQMAVANKLKVITTCSARNAAWMKELGATYIVDYNSDNLVEKVKEFTNGELTPLVYDTIGVKEAYECVQFGGQIGIINGVAPEVNLFLNGVTVHNLLLGMNALQPIRAIRERIGNAGKGTMSLVTDGKLKLKIGKEVKGLDALLEELIALENGESRGKVIATL